MKSLKKNNQVGVSTEAFCPWWTFFFFLVFAIFRWNQSTNILLFFLESQAPKNPKNFTLFFSCHRQNHQQPILLPYCNLLGGKTTTYTYCSWLIHVLAFFTLCSHSTMPRRVVINIHIRSPVRPLPNALMQLLSHRACVYFIECGMNPRKT